MTIIDRYIVGGFLKIFLICFLSFSGLFVVVDAFTNLEEFLDLGRSSSLPEVMLGYYGPRLLQFFDRTAPLIALVAAIFTVAFMQRSNELTAILAGGISKRRVAKPILWTTAIILLLAIFNREALLPRYRDQLAMQPQDLAGGKGRTIGPTRDHETGIGIRGKEVMPVHQTIQDPVFTLPSSLAKYGSRLSASKAEYLTANDQHPAGYLLTHVTRDQEAAVTEADDGQAILFFPQQHAWLGPDQVFVASQVDTLQLAFPKAMSRTATLREMIHASHLPRSTWSNQLKVDIHWRIVQPVFDMTILLIGLPLVISRGERNLFLSAGICMLVVMSMVLIVIASQGMGAASILNPPSLAAWLPVILFLPATAVTIRLLDR